MLDRPVSTLHERDSEVDIIELWNILWKAKWLILSFTGIVALSSYFYSITLPDVYRAEATLAPTENSQGGSVFGSQLGGAAALVGLNLGVQESSRINTTIAILQSREFLGNFINEHNLLPYLFAASWDDTNGKSIIDPAIFDTETGLWVGERGKPSALEAYRLFRSTLNVYQDRVTNLIHISIEWTDPVAAEKWVNWLVSDINRDSKLHDVLEANSAISYLRSQLETTQLVEMQRVFYQLIESQTRITMLADVREEYVFRVIDPAVAPDQKIAPRRSMYLIVGALIGAFLSIIYVLLSQAARLRGVEKWATSSVSTEE